MEDSMSAPFASRTTVTIPIPFDPPNEVTLRKLAGRHLERAKSAFLQRLVRDVQQRGGAAVQKDMEQLFRSDESSQDTAATVQAVKADPLNGYDKYELAAAGIKSWTYPESLVPQKVLDEDGHEVLRVVAIDDLEDEGLTFFATEVMRITKPSLFQTEDEAEADRKND